MSDYWVKPTIEQLRAELEWERQQTVIRRKRRRVISAVAVAIAVLFLGGAVLIPRTADRGYALEESIEASVEESADDSREETEADKPDEPRNENAVASGE